MKRMLVTATAAAVSLLALVSCSGKQASSADSAVVAAQSREGSATLASGEDYAIRDNVIVPVSMPAVVDFYADWCPPCRQYMPVLEHVEKQFAGTVLFLRINVDEQPELARRYVGKGIPTTAFILPGGSVMGSVEGALSEETLTEYVNQLVAQNGQTNVDAL